MHKGRCRASSCAVNFFSNWGRSSIVDAQSVEEVRAYEGTSVSPYFLKARIEIKVKYSI